LTATAASWPSEVKKLDRKVFNELRHFTFSVDRPDKQNCASRFYGTDVLCVRVNVIAAFCLYKLKSGVPKEGAMISGRKFINHTA